MEEEKKLTWCNKIYWILIILMVLTIIALVFVILGVEQRNTKKLKIDANQKKTVTNLDLTKQWKKIKNNNQLSTPIVNDDQFISNPVSNVALFPRDFVPACLNNVSYVCIISMADCVCDDPKKKGYVINPVYISGINDYFYFIQEVTIEIDSYIYDINRGPVVERKITKKIQQVLVYDLLNRDTIPYPGFDAFNSETGVIMEMFRNKDNTQTNPNFYVFNNNSIPTTTENPVIAGECDFEDYASLLLGIQDPNKCKSFGESFNMTDYIKIFKKKIKKETPKNQAKCTEFVRDILKKEPTVCEEGCSRGCLKEQTNYELHDDTSVFCDDNGEIIIPQTIVNYHTVKSIKTIANDIDSKCGISMRDVIVCQQNTNNKTISIVKNSQHPYNTQIPFDNLDEEGIIKFLGTESPCYYSGMSFSFLNSFDSISGNQTTCSNNNTLFLYPHACKKRDYEEHSVSFKYKSSDGIVSNIDDNNIFSFQNCSKQDYKKDEEKHEKNDDYEEYDHYDDDEYIQKRNSRFDHKNKKFNNHHKKNNKWNNHHQHKPKVTFEVAFGPSTITHDVPPPKDCNYYSMFVTLQTKESLNFS